MKIVNLIQGTTEWHAHRAQHYNASDAPAMMGCSPYKTRAQLVREVATGVAQEVDAATQRRFDDGHRFEELARPLAEEIIGAELYPVTGTNGKLSASFDGLTMDGGTGFEHKSLNDQLRAAMVDGCTGADLPLLYQVQMEQQLAVSDAARVLFMASKWNGEELVEERHCWYVSNPELRDKIVAGWAQFEADVAAYEPEAAKAEPVAAPIAGFGALTIRVEGRVLASNMDAFKANAEAFLAQLPRADQLQTDQDFVDAEAAAKACSEAEARIKAATESTLGEMIDIDALLRTASAVSEAIRQARLALEKAVKVEKENRRAQIVADGAKAVRVHYDSINASLGEHRIQPSQSLQLDLAAAIKGKKSLSSMQDAVAGAVATCKIDASQAADRIRANIAILDGHDEHATLFADRVQLCASKAPEDLRNLAKARIAEHDQREADKLEAEREKIRAEEAAKLQQAQAPTPQPAPVEQPRANVPAAGTPVPAASTAVAGQRIKLGDINAAITPLSITADGLALLGFRPVATDRSAKLYDVGQLPGIYEALRSLIVDAENN
ncbi:MAG: YqaJ viral recombinase family protein, partial [Stenotrophomonas sp.]